MLKCASALILAALAAAPAQAQEAAPAPTRHLSRALSGDLVGPQSVEGAMAQGWLRVDTVLDGRWVRCLGASLAGGRSLRSFVQMMREDAGGAVTAWRFDEDGRVSVWTGTVTERGLGLEWRDEEGRVLARQEWGFENGDVDYRLSRREDEAQKFRARVSGSLRRSGQRPRWEPSEAALERIAANPYRTYLGLFRGQESGPLGATTGEVGTEAVLDGRWFYSIYTSRQEDRVVYRGHALIRCDAEGRYELFGFDSGTEVIRIDGRVDEAGAEAFVRDAEGEPVERHTDRFTATGYRYTLAQRDDQGGWREVLTATYAREVDPAEGRPEGGRDD